MSATADVASEEPGVESDLNLDHTRSNALPSLPPPVPLTTGYFEHRPESSHISSALNTPSISSATRETSSEVRQSITIRPHRRQNAPKEWLARLTSFAHAPIKSRPKTAATSQRRPSMKTVAPTMEIDPTAVPDNAVPTRRAIKIRLVTHNMHDCLSTGDLSEVLGTSRSLQSKARQHSLSSASTHSVPAPDGLPVFSLASPQGPYHLIVIASQECPTASGVLAGKVRTLNGRGWTSILEDHLCGDQGIDDDDDEEGEGEGDVQAVYTDATSNRSGTGHRRRGPYVLVEKARLMGIYLAVFCARECEALIEGVSTGRVTAGLIGGRLGNKGAVGISLQIASSRLLFISAHLAAHSHAIEMRKANILKIFTELEVDDFLGPGPKPLHLTDRFDQTFFMGDLNFRLDISRLQADWWCVKTQDYTTALEFDQLRRVLNESDSVLKGFAEGEVKFAPTYKYDVPAKVRKRRSTMLRASRHVKRAPREWTSFEPAEVESGATTDPETLQATQQESDNRDDDGLSTASDRESIASGLSDYDKVEKQDIPALGLPSSPSKGNVTSMEAVRKAAHVRFLTLVRTNSAAAAFVNAARRANEADRAALAVTESAQTRETDSHVSSVSSSARDTPRRRKMTLAGAPALPVVRPVLRSSHSELVLPLPRGSTSFDSADSDAETPPASPSTPGASTDNFAASFDSSAKQRVQSYTDRILFKTTVIPPEPVDGPVGRRSSGFVDSLRGLVQGPTYFDRPRPALKHSATDASASSAQRQTRFSATDASPPATTRTTSFGLKRAKSLQSNRLQRRASLAYSVKSSKSHDETGRSLWTRVSSKTKTAPHGPTSSSRPATPPLVAQPDTRTLEIRSRKPTFKTKSAPSSPALSRSNTRVMTDPMHSPPPSPTDISHRSSRTLGRPLPRSSSTGHGGGSINRIKSFFHMPLPFLHRASMDGLSEAVHQPSRSDSPPLTVGPRKGEIQVLIYDAIADLNKMGAISDHRPVVATIAIGIGGDPVLV